MTQEFLSDANLDAVCGGLQPGYVYCTGNRAPAGDGIYAGDFCPGATNAEVYAPFFEGIRKGMGK